MRRVEAARALLPRAGSWLRAMGEAQGERTVPAAAHRRGAAPPPAGARSRSRLHWSAPWHRRASAGAGHGSSNGGGSDKRPGSAASVTAATLAVSVAGVAWLTYEDRRGGLTGGPFEPLTLHVAAVSWRRML
jgi:hypothetical protein